jgi:NADPH-dependent glutamate synthase beta subunit-like oxidoreductase
MRQRDGFKLTDPGTDLTGALDEANYCIWCHEQGKDSCSKGLMEKPAAGAAVVFKKSHFGVPLAGCPLEERISEFHKLKSEGWPIGALAMIVIDNPTVCATGHRICNDCMKSCIYQRQEPVNIPQAETHAQGRARAAVGFDHAAFALEPAEPSPTDGITGQRVLVVGMRPTSFTLAHHLLNEGHGGRHRRMNQPRRRSRASMPAAARALPPDPQHLDARAARVANHGGLRRSRMRHHGAPGPGSQMARLLVGSARGSYLARWFMNLTAESAFASGFDHVALALGAGKPTVLDLPHGLARGVRAASDFLMALQLTGAAREESIANLTVRLPIVVVGGGLTAIDTATESLAYYAVQVEKFLARYETLTSERSASAVRNEWTEEETDVAEEYLMHALAIREERVRAVREGREPHVLELLQSWGGSTIAYRRRLIDSPSYTLNHEEVEKALEEGIRFAENLTPLRVEVDEFGHAARLAVGPHRRCRRQRGPARRAAARQDDSHRRGQRSYTVLAREEPDYFKLDGRYFRAVDDDGNAVTPQRSAKPAVPNVLMWRDAENRFMSYFGDLHPSFFGNVVKAMGSAKQGYPVVSRILARRPARSGAENESFLAGLNAQLRATIHHVERLTRRSWRSSCTPAAAAVPSRPVLPPAELRGACEASGGTTLAMEGIALTGAWVIAPRVSCPPSCWRWEDRATRRRRSPRARRAHGSHRNRDRDAWRGDRGPRRRRPGNAVSIGAALRSRVGVLYFAGYKKLQDRTGGRDRGRRGRGGGAATNRRVAPTRPSDKTFVGNVGRWPRTPPGRSARRRSTADADRLIAIGPMG